MKIIFWLHMLIILACSQPGARQQSQSSMNEPSQPKPSGLQTATFGGGCFWCTEAVFKRVKGVYQVSSGYSGGKISNPTYREVTSGLTGHAEVVQLQYDPAEVPYIKLLEIFFRTHDPTSLNRQGADVGTQYRSVIFYHNEKQQQQASQIMKELDQAGIWDKPIVTELVPMQAFYKAEEYHQDYFEKNPTQGYCQFVIVPKIGKLENLFKDYLKE